MDDSELDALRQKRMAELQQNSQQQAAAQEQRQQIEAQKQAILRQIMQPDARDRLANVKIANPELANSVEMQLIQLAQTGRLQDMVTDAMLRNILRQVAPQKREITIERR